MKTKNQLICALALTLACALAPIFVSIQQLSLLSQDLNRVKDVSGIAQQAQNVLATASNAIHNFNAIFLDLSDEERAEILSKTDRHLQELENIGKEFNFNYLVQDLEKEKFFLQELDNIVHSWSEMRDQIGRETSDFEKGFHFLRLNTHISKLKAALDAVVLASKEAEKIASEKFSENNAKAKLVITVVIFGACAVGVISSISVHRKAIREKEVNNKLTLANELIVKEEKKVSQKSQHFEAALRNMSQGLCMFDGKKSLIVCNNRFVELYAIPQELTASGTDFYKILEYLTLTNNYYGEDSESYIIESLKIAEENGELDQTVELKTGRAIRIVRRPMINGGWVATHEDITEHRLAEERIAYLAHHDALTGLPNRALLKIEMQKALSRVTRGEQLAILCLDLDRFKSVNDTLGHPVGDQLLEAVAARLCECTRDNDTIARLGGDEFAIVQVNAQPTGSIALARRIIEHVSKPYDVDGHRIVIGVSIGISTAPNDGVDSDDLLKNADMALYRAKAEGRGAYRFFEPSMDAEMQSRRMMEIDLRAAHAEDQFELHYQPLVDLENNKVTGFEALLRWNHPKRGKVSPADFIPLAEETGMIVQIGAWVLKNACNDACDWPPDIKLSVNVSPVQFKSKSLVADVKAALLESGLPAPRLDLEVTESIMLKDTDVTLQVLHELRGLGVSISMDDFGTGYSSLGYLQKFPFNKIKIDQSFVRGMGDQSSSVAIVRAVSGIGDSLGMTTTAEGVETEEQLRMLMGQGCSEVQGYYFSKPRPANEVKDIIKKINGRGKFNVFNKELCSS